MCWKHALARERTLRAYGFALVGEGASRAIWENPANDIKSRLFRDIGGLLFLHCRHARRT